MALASLYTLACAYAGCKHGPKLPDILRSWGLSIDADDLDKVFEKGREEDTDRALLSFFGSPQGKDNS